MNKILVVAPHPDDELLGLGGTILNHKSNGDDINWLIMTDIRASEKYSDERKKDRQGEIIKVSDLVGFTKTINLEYEPCSLDVVPMSELVDKLSSAFQAIKPNIVYLPFKFDIHTDHQQTFQAAFSVTKNFRYPFVKKILMYETLSETDFSPAFHSERFTPNVFVDISKTMNKKIEILQVYKSELGEHPFPRNQRAIEALALLRGAACACEYAEGFMLLKDTQYFGV